MTRPGGLEFNSSFPEEIPAQNQADLGPGKILLESLDIQRANHLFQSIDNDVINPRNRALITNPLELRLLEAVLPEIASSVPIGAVGGRLRPHLDEAFAIARMSGSYFHIGYQKRKIELSIDRQLKALFPEDYSKLATPEFWVQNDVMAQIDPDRFFLDMAFRRQAYNNPNAYSIFHLETQALKRRLGRPPIVVDVGGAGGIAEVKWALSQNYPFRPMKMYKQPEAGEPISYDLKTDSAAQEAVNDLTGRAPVIGGALTVDILPIAHDSDAKDWSYCNTFPMGEELRDPEAAAEFKQLQNEDRQALAKEHNVLIYGHMVDARDPASLEVLKKLLPGGKADFFILSGVIMQMSPEEISQVIQNLSVYANEGAVVSVNEWARLDHRQPSGLKVIREGWWHRLGAFSNFIIELDNPDKPPIHIGDFMTRKCDGMILSPAGRQLLAEAY